MSTFLRFEGKVAIVTGASHGIGCAIARRLSNEGAAVAVFDIDGDAARDIAQSLPNARAFDVDVTDEVALGVATQAAVDEWGGIDILVNNAGGALMPQASFWEFETAAFRRVTDVNFLGQWLCTKTVLPALRRRGSGVIVNVASVAGFQPISGVAPYSAAKAAVINLTQTMARELGGFNIRVNAIAPGYIRFTRRKAVLNEEQVAELERTVLGTQLLRRIGEPEDVAGSVSFLCSTDAAHITGQLLVVNGGAF
jgi:meso-butanediol dehydrogenase/(S,S)-butanediol dehydrogenase/diacetyl reductase